MQFRAVKNRLQSCITQIQTTMEKPSSKAISQLLEDKSLRLQIWSSDSGLATVESRVETDSQTWKFVFELLGLLEARLKSLDANLSNSETLREPEAAQSEIPDQGGPSRSGDEQLDQEV